MVKKTSTFLMLLFLVLACQRLSAQALSLSDLFSALEMNQNGIDTLMKKREYRILEKEKDSTANLIYYTNLERTESATWVRSVSFTDQINNKSRSRIINYRTYRKKEYQEMVQWMLNNNFKTASTVNYGREKITVYTDGARKLQIKISVQKLPNGTPVSAYEVEIGTITNTKP